MTVERGPTDRAGVYREDIRKGATEAIRMLEVTGLVAERIGAKTRPSVFSYDLRTGDCIGAATTT